MTFTLATYDRKYLDQMCRVYNDETAFEPHIAPLTAEMFTKFVEARSYFDPAGLLLAIEGGKVVGWVHAAVAHATEGYYDPVPPVAKIQMLIFPRERLDVGNALVAEATAWLKKSGQTKLLAMHCDKGYPFYRCLWLGGEPMGTVAMPHVQLAFEVGGYKNTHESVFLVAKMADLPAEVPTAEPIRIVDGPAAMKHAPMAESWTGFEPQESFGYLGEQKVAGVGWTLVPQVAPRLGAPAMTIWSLGVNQEQRRKGFGAALTSRALRSGYRAGARFCTLGTQLWNAPAHATYAKLGFVPYCILVGRTLDLEAAQKKA
jgi:GNAT superfamily N-acetyltransferase